MIKKIISLVLCAAFAIAMIPAGAEGDVKAAASGWSIYVNGQEKSLRGYNIGGANYYKLRDIAAAVSGTEKQFEVEWRAETNEIHMSSKRAYTRLGGELEGGAVSDTYAVPTVSPVYADGVRQSCDAYYIRGNNYFKLRDILKIFDIGLIWSETGKTVHIDTNASYTDEADEADEQAQVVVVRKLDKYRNLISESLGFIISDDGAVATTFMAVYGADIVTVSFPGQPEQDIEGIVAYNKARNLAVLKTQLESSAPLTLARGAVGTAKAYLKSGRGLAVHTGSVTGEIPSDRISGARDMTVSFELSPGSAGAPVTDGRGNVLGMVYSTVYRGSQTAVIIPAEEISTLNLSAEPETVEKFMRREYFMRGNASEDMVSDMIYERIKPLRIGEERIDVFGVRAEVTDSINKKMHIQVYIPENEGDGYYFRQASGTVEGAEKIFGYCKTMLDVVEAYYPEYEIEGEILCVWAKVLETDEDGRITKYETRDNKYNYGRKVTFGYGCEYNGWAFEVE